MSSSIDIAVGYSDPEDASDYSAHNVIGRGFKKRLQHAAFMGNSAKLAGLNLEAFEAVSFSRGQSLMLIYSDTLSFRRGWGRGFGLGVLRK